MAGFFLMHHSPRYILLDAVKTALRAVLADIGKIKRESPHFRGAVGPRNCDVLLGRREMQVI